MIKEIFGFKGNIIWDDSKPNGTPRKLMYAGKMEVLGWEFGIGLRDGISHLVNNESDK